MKSEKNENYDFEAEILQNIGPISTNKLVELDNFIVKGFFPSIEIFIQYFSENSKHSACASSWNQLSVSCSCSDCQFNSNNCLCVRCFLEGPHKHHKCSVHLSSSGNCDCGDHSAWKLSGTCKRHQIKNDTKSNYSINSNFQYDYNDDDYFVPTVEEPPNCHLSPKLKKRLILSFQEIRKDIEKMTETMNFRFFENCCQWYLKFSQLGDEIRNLIIDVFNNIEFLKRIIINSKNMNKEKMKAFFLLMGALNNNYVFSISFLESIVQVVPDLLETARQSSTVPFRIYDSPPVSGISIIISFGYQYYNNYAVTALTKLKKFDWINYILKIIDLNCNFITSEENYNTYLNFESIFKITSSIKYILRAVLKIESEKTKIKHFFIELCKSIQKFEGFCHSNFGNNVQIYDAYHFFLKLPKLPHKIVKNIDFFVPEVVDIFIWHLLSGDKYENDRKQLKNYSMLTMLHQLFINDMMIFNKRNEKEEELAINNDEVFNVCYHSTKAKELFNYYCILNLKRKNLIDENETKTTKITQLINEIYLKAIELPMASIAAHYLFTFDEKPLNGPNRIVSAIKRFHITSSVYTTYILPRLISLVQMIFSFTEKNNKDVMIRRIAEYFEAFNSKYSANQQKIRNVAFIMFICFLIFDRDCINNDIMSMSLKNLMTAMKVEKVDMNEIQSLISPFKLTNEKFLDKYNKMNIDTDWDIVIPCYHNSGYLYSHILPSIIGKTQNFLLPFPEFKDPQINNDNDNGFGQFVGENVSSPSFLLQDLNEVFECKFIFASIFYVIYEYNTDKIILQYALNLFISFIQNSKEIKQDEKFTNLTINARNIDELVTNIPTNNFRIFSKMNVCFKNNKSISLIQLIDDLGLIGLNALRQVGLSEKVIKKPKKEINNMKKLILNKYREKRQKFASSIDRQSQDCCSICHKVYPPKQQNQSKSIDFILNNENNNDDDEICENNLNLLYIPIILYENVSTSFYDNFKVDTNSKIGSSLYIRRPLDLQYVHLNCFKKRNVYSSPVFLMPKIDFLPKNFMEKNRKLEIDHILSQILKFLNETHINREPIGILSRMIFILDYRSRLIPEILDDSSISILYLNFFRNCTFVANFSRNFIMSSANNSIEKVILNILIKNSPSEGEICSDEEKEYERILKMRENQKLEKISFDQFIFSKIVKNSFDSESDNLNEYLRRCYLIEKFYLSEKNEMDDILVDWNSVLDFDHLYSHFYHLKKNDTDQITPELHVYRGLKLPHYFLEFIYPPYNISFSPIVKKCSLCLFTGVIYEDNYGFMNSKTKFGMPFTVILNLYGHGISSISVVQNKRFDNEHQLSKSIYIDKNGFEDFGFKRGSNLVLSHERYMKLIDAFLSGDILDNHFNF